MNISGKLVSVQPITLSKAARYISDFASFENNGASEVISIYLNRASEAFSSLVQLHKDLKHPQSSYKKSRKKSYDGKEKGTSLRNVEVVDYDDGERKSRSRDENQGQVEEKGVGVSEKDSISSELRKGSENCGNVEVNQMKKKSKKKKNEIKEEEKGIEQGRKNETKETSAEGKLDAGRERESKKKKRKSVDLDDEVKENSIEPSKKKRKRSKVSAD